MKKKLEYKQYIDKVHGAWVGKCAGGILGAPIEGYKKFNSILLDDSLFESNFANDDLDLQLLWLDMVLRKGTYIRENDFKEHWKAHVAFPWNEYGIATRNIRLGLDNPDSGSHNNWYWRHSMGSPIRSELWGMLCAGNPKKAAFYAKMDSTLDHSGFSVEAEQYLAACMAIAFVEDNVFSILTEGLNFISNHGSCARLIRSIIFWNREYGAEITAKKIKSLYGDADFTSAPMNIGFTVLSLLNSQGEIDNLGLALHYGHDSDCIIATAGALLGAIIGYNSLPKIWKDRVGDEILVSAEITGIDCPKTITKLTTLTFRAAMPFFEANQNLEISGTPKKGSTTEFPLVDYALNTYVKDYPLLDMGDKGILVIEIENFKEVALALNITLGSDFFEVVSKNVSIPPKQKLNLEVELFCLPHAFATKPSLTYSIEVDDGKNTNFFHKGLPYYGKWLLLGPFIEDDSSLAPMDEVYPDHGMASLPSVKYMNHDAQRPTRAFIDQNVIQEILKLSDFGNVPFGSQLIFPKSMEIDLGNYFYGKGERTLYLYTQINVDTATKKWLCLGHSNYGTVWLNDEKLYRTETPMRRWPGTETIELVLKKGLNQLLLRFDFINDNFLVNIGLKEHQEKHHHQSQWDTELLFTIPDLQNDQGANKR